MKIATKNYIVRPVFLIFAVIWMITVFKFSNQPADTSQNTSLNLTKRIVNVFFAGKSSIEKEQITDKLDPYIRKLAHFTLYAIGGILIANYINTYNIKDKNKIIYSIGIGATYACTDEFHQLFVEGRSGQLTDVLIDSLGVATGVCIFLCVITIFKKLFQYKQSD